MMREGIDFLDGDYENVSLGKKPRQIRTKSTSFSQIKKYFTDFRVRLLNKKLERELENISKEITHIRLTVVNYVNLKDTNMKTLISGYEKDK